MQRTLLAVAGAAILIPQLLRIPFTLSILRQGYFDTLSGSASALVLGALFAVQLFRGRWLVGSCCFLAVLIVGTIYSIESISDIPFRRLFLTDRIPSIAASVVAFSLILCVRVSNRK